MFAHSSLAKKNKARRLSGPSRGGRRPSAYSLKPTRSLSPSYPSPCHSLASTSSRSSLGVALALEGSSSLLYPGRSQSASGVADLGGRWLTPTYSRSHSAGSEAAAAAEAARRGGSVNALCRQSGGALNALCRQSGGSVNAICRKSGGSENALCNQSGGALNALCRQSFSRQSEGSVNAQSFSRQSFSRQSDGSVNALCRQSFNRQSYSTWCRQNATDVPETHRKVGQFLVFLLSLLLIVCS